MKTVDKHKKMFDAYFYGDPKECFALCENREGWEAFRRKIPQKLSSRAYKIMHEMDEDAQEALDKILMK